MKFALVNNLKTEATKGAKGTCINCGFPLIARCGTVRMHHWVHATTPHCDPWKEKHQAWHRQWINKFPRECQEISVSDEATSERHIADVCTEHDLVIKFQLSGIYQEEQIAQESFYKNMIWVVNGTQPKYRRFLKRKNSFRETGSQGYYFVDFPALFFPSAWVESSVPVIFDFLGMESKSDQYDLRSFLFCLLPTQKGESAIVAVMSRSLFIDHTIKGLWFKKEEKPPTQVHKSGNPKKSQSVRRNDQYVFEEGQWKKRRHLKPFSIFL